MLPSLRDCVIICLQTDACCLITKYKLAAERPVYCSKESIVREKVMVFLVVALCCSQGLSQSDKPFIVDEDTLVLLHLDGDHADSSERCKSETIKDVEYAPGKFGKAIRTNKGGLSVGPSTVLDFGDRSWMVECWVKPDIDEAKDSYGLLGSLMGNGRMMILSIVDGKRLQFVLNAGPNHNAGVSSADIGGTLFDGRWHHVAAVVDRARNGELRLYLDGEEVTGRQAAQPLVPTSGGDRVWIAIGASMKWYVGSESAFRGLIDELRITAGIRPGFEAKPDSPMPPAAKPLKGPRPEAAIRPDDPLSAEPMALTPDGTLIVVGTFCHYADLNTAKLLQSNLRRAYETERGFEIVNDFKLDEDPGGRAILAVGQTRFAAEADGEGLETFGFRIRRRGKAVIFTGGSDKGALYGVVRFLDRFCGVRFYMPGELFTSRPKKTPITLGGIDITDAPYVKVAASHTHGAPEGGTFMTLHGLDRRPTSHQHTMYHRFLPERYAEKYPKIFPTIDGERYVPQPGDQRWQPCFSEPTLVDAAVESATEFFREHQDIGYVAFSIQDAHVYSERDLASEVVAAQIAKLGEKDGRVQGLSNLYWAWLNKVAERMEKTHPDKKIVGLVYGSVRMPPPFKLHKNIIAWMVFKMSDIVIDQRFTDNLPYIKAWTDAASAVGHHDWSYGYGFLIPRIYTNYFQKTFLEFDKMGAPIRCAYAEAGPNWGLDGPKLYLMARLWVDPHTDVEAELKQFCNDMFGPAAGEMLTYFTLMEDLFCNHLNRRTEQKLFRWPRQFTEWTDKELEMLARARGLLDEVAKRTKPNSAEAKRIELFSKTLRLTEMLVAIGNAEKVSPTLLDNVRDYLREVIVPDPMTIHARGKREELGTLIIEPILKQIARGKLPK